MQSRYPKALQVCVCLQVMDMIDINDDDVDITGPHHIHLSVCLFTGNGHD